MSSGVNDPTDLDLTDDLELTDPLPERDRAHEPAAFAEPASEQPAPPVGLAPVAHSEPPRVFAEEPAAVHELTIEPELRAETEPPTEPEPISPPVDAEHEPLPTPAAPLALAEPEPISALVEAEHEPLATPAAPLALAKPETISALVEAEHEPIATPAAPLAFAEPEPLALELPTQLRPEPELNAAPPVAAEPEMVPMAAATPLPAAPGRLVSVDAYRGLVMILMISAGLQFTHVVKLFDTTPGWVHLHTALWQQLAFQTDHTTWTGSSLWDMIQPSFMLLVGTAMAFSLANRAARGERFGKMLFHALLRSLVLVLLSVFLISNFDNSSTRWQFTNVLAQIGLGYPCLFLIAWLKPRWQLVVAIAILAAYWGAFAIYPAPAANLDLHSFSLPDNWVRLQGFASHWEKNTNLAARVDQWFLNLFPRVDGKPFQFERGGYQTLNFIPSLATMLFGLLAGELLRNPLSGIKKVSILLAAGVVAGAAGWALDRYGICPIVKRIWTPSWTLFSGGIVFVTLALFYVVIDLWRLRKWALPFVVVGANSIAIYCIAETMQPWVRDSMRRHFGQGIYELPGRAYAWLRYGLFSHSPHPVDAISAYGTFFAPVAEAGFFLLFCWMLCWWAYRRKLFIRI